MAEIQYFRAIQDALAEEMRRDERVFLTGEAVSPLANNTIRATEEMWKEFGEKRIRRHDDGFDHSVQGRLHRGLRRLRSAYRGAGRGRD